MKLNAAKELNATYNDKYLSALEQSKTGDLKEKQITEELKASVNASKSKYKNDLITKLELEHEIYNAELKAIENMVLNNLKKIDAIKPVLEWALSNGVAKDQLMKSEMLLQKALLKNETYDAKKGFLIAPKALPVINEEEEKEKAFISAKEALENEQKEASLVLDGLKFIDEFNKAKYIEMKTRYSKYILLDLEGKPVVTEIVTKKGKSLVTYLHRKFHDFREWNTDDFFFVEVNDKQRKMLFAQHWLETKELRVKYDSSTFEPNPEFNDDGVYNFWKGFVEPIRGNVQPFYDHVNKLIKGTAEEKMHIIKKFAFCVRYPHINFGTVPAFRGKQGSGKTTLAGDTWLALCPNHTMLTSNLEKFLDGFNGETLYMKFVIGEEAVWGGDKRLEGKFKHAITGSTREIEIKGITKFHIPNHCQFFLTSNEDWIMPVGDGDRRAEIFDCTDDLVGEEHHAYFAEYRRWLYTEGKHALVYHFMHEIDLEGFNPRSVIENAAKLDVKLTSLGQVEKFIYNALNGDIGQENLDKWNDIDFIIRREDLFNAFKEATKSKIDQKIFSGTLKKIFSFPDNWKDNWKNSTKGSFYRLGSLAEARAKFAASINAEYELLFGEKIEAKKEEVKTEERLVPKIQMPKIIVKERTNVEKLLSQKKVDENEKKGPTLGFMQKRNK